MNRSGVEWADWTLNVITGCLNDCWYCYVPQKVTRRTRGRFGWPADEPMAPTFHSDRLDEPRRVRKPSKIFLESCGELWGPWVPIEWQDAVMDMIDQCPQHTFINPTKNPEGIVRYLSKPQGRFHWRKALPQNLWVGVSLDTVQRVDYLPTFQSLLHPTKFLSCEPLLEDITQSPHWSLDGIRWIIIGALTGKRARQPEPEWVDKIGGQASLRGIPVFLKNNLVGHEVQEFPASFPRRVAT